MKVLFKMVLTLLMAGVFTACDYLDFFSPEEEKVVPLKILSVNPVDSEENAALDCSVVLRLNQELTEFTVSHDNVKLTTDYGEKVPVTLDYIYAGGASSITVDPLYSLNPGTRYYISISRDIEDVRGMTLGDNARFSFTTIGNFESEPDNDMAVRATVLVPGVVTVGRINSINDKDYYQIVVPSDKLMKISVETNQFSGTVVDLKFEVNNGETGEVLTTKEDSDGTLNAPTSLEALVQAPVGKDTIYTVLVTDSLTDGNPDYDDRTPYFITVSFEESPDINEPNGNGVNYDENRVLASPLLSGTAVTGYIEFWGDEDWYVLETTPEVNSLLQINLTTENTSVVNTPVDFAVYVNNGNTPVMYSSDGSRGFTILENIPEFLPGGVSGKYYFKVRDYGSDREYDLKSPYEFTVTVIPDPDINEPNGNGLNLQEDLDSATSVIPGVEKEFYIEYRGDTDWFMVDGLGAGGSIINIQLSNSVNSTPVDIELETYNFAPGTLLDTESPVSTLSDTNGMDGRTVLTQMVTMGTDRIYFRIRDYQNNEYDIENPFRLLVTLVP